MAKPGPEETSSHTARPARTLCRAGTHPGRASQPAGAAWAAEGQAAERLQRRWAPRAATGARGLPAPSRRRRGGRRCVVTPPARPPPAGREVQRVSHTCGYWRRNRPCGLSLAHPRRGVQLGLWDVGRIRVGQRHCKLEVHLLACRKSRGRQHPLACLVPALAGRQAAAAGGAAGGSAHRAAACRAAHPAHPAPPAGQQTWQSQSGGWCLRGVVGRKRER